MNKIVTDLGPVAATYDELQGLPHIREAWGGGAMSASEKYLRSRLQCVELIWLNTIQLCERLGHAISSENWDEAAEQTIWLSALGAIAHSISKSCRADCRLVQDMEPNPASPLRSAALHEMLRHLHQLETQAMPVFELKKKRFQAAIQAGGPTDALATVVQRLKIFFRYVQVSLENLDRVVVPLSGADYSNAIRAESLVAAFREPSMRGETYFTQFRLMHQIPELLGLDGLAACERLKQGWRKNYIAIVRDVAMLNDVSEIALNCLAPLIMELFPSSYYRIRNNLGITSGSHSVTLSKQLFSQRFVELSDLFAQLAVDVGDNDDDSDDGNDDAARLAITFWQRYHANVYAWRAAHAHLPRNVLGGPGTKSLIGSPDAVSAVERMRFGIAKSDAFEPPLWERMSPESAGIFKEIMYDAVLDRWLLSVTGEVAQAEFPNVQKRQGRYKRRRSTE